MEKVVWRIDATVQNNFRRERLLKVSVIREAACACPEIFARNNAWIVTTSAIPLRNFIVQLGLLGKIAL
jgi:hypothetical protein